MWRSFRLITTYYLLEWTTLCFLIQWQWNNNILYLNFKSPPTEDGGDSTSVDTLPYYQWILWWRKSHSVQRLVVCHGRCARDVDISWYSTLLLMTKTDVTQLEVSGWYYWLSCTQILLNVSNPLGILVVDNVLSPDIRGDHISYWGINGNILTGNLR